MNTKAQLIASRLDCKTLRASNDDLFKTCTTYQQKLSNFQTSVLELEAEPEASYAPSSNPNYAVCDRDCCKELLESFAVRVQ